MKRFLIFAIVLLQGCVVGPDYRRPMTVVPEQWHAKVEPKSSFSESLPQAEWWRVFQDPLLNKYMELSAKYNKDVQIARTNVCKAKAARAYAESFFYPQLFSDINATRQAFSKNGPVFILPGTSTGTPFKAFPPIQNLFNILFDASWEIDLFGKNYRRAESAKDRFYSAVEEMNDTMVTLFAEVARNYVEVRGAQEMIALTEKNMELLKESQAMIRKRVDHGLDNDLSLLDIESELANVAANLPVEQANVLSGIYNLSLLTGAFPEQLLCEMLVPQALPKIPSCVAVGLRSELLRRRPDIRKAEWDLAAATADIGFATAAFFPTFTLTGSVGLQSVQLGDLLEGRSGLWSVEGDLNTPLFQGGRLKANLALSRAQAEAVFLTYQKTILTAVTEAEGALAYFIEDQKVMLAYEQAVQSRDRSVTIIEQRYKKGIVNIINVLNGEQQLITAEENLSTSHMQALLDLIRLYKALGGGWEICLK